MAVLATLGLCSTDIASLSNHHPDFPCFLRAAAAAALSAGAVAARAAAVQISSLHCRHV